MRGMALFGTLRWRNRNGVGAIPSCGRSSVLRAHGFTPVSIARTQADLAPGLWTSSSHIRRGADANLRQSDARAREREMRLRPRGLVRI